MDATEDPSYAHIEDPDDVKVLLQKDYGLNVTSMKQLNGYYDLNYHVQVEADHKNDNIDVICPHGYLVKVVNAIESKSIDYHIGRKLVMDHLRNHKIECQQHVKTIDGKFFSSIKSSINAEGSEDYLVSVRTFLPGVVMTEVTPLTPKALFDFGVFTAKLLLALQDFEYPFYKSYSPLWSFDNFLKVKSVAHVIKDEKTRNLIDQVFEAFESKVLPRRNSFRKGQIHGDLNDQNVLVEKKGDDIVFCSVLDFQDSTQSCLVYDLAVAIMYMMVLPDVGVPLNDIGGHVIAGYQTIMPLNESEKESLWTLIAARMVTSLVYCAYNYMQQPTNDYILINSKIGLEVFLKFWNISDDTVWKRWNEVIKSYS